MLKGGMSCRIRSMLENCICRGLGRTYLGYLVGRSRYQSGSQKPLCGYPWDWVECEKKKMEES
jgi:hypothetical protein